MEYRRTPTSTIQRYSPSKRRSLYSISKFTRESKAAEYFRRATELDPNFALAWKNLGYADVNLGNTQEATNALKKYLTLEPKAEDAQEVQELIAALNRP